eukprot:GFUD01019857.1.p1 GENE.GFUD01019857.1~~GFUD01019857.1.p1  ORF type:complete len:364 (-),score=78.84 GFUD01019857.1:68-1159(-)
MPPTEETTPGSAGKKKVYEYGILSANSSMKEVDDTEAGPAVSSCPSCSNSTAPRTHRQSPINIEQKTARFQEFRPFQFIGYEKLSIARGTLKAKNTGGTLKLLADLGIGLLGGGPLNVQYEFVEMHYHWGDLEAADGRDGSEHKIDGKSYPLELHMVHKNIHDPSIHDALCHENGLCVLAFVFEEVDYDVTVPGLDTLTTIIEQHLIEANSVFDQAKHKEVHKEVGHNHQELTVANFLPFLIEEYFTYRGSLTTGGCEEAVNWVFFKTPLAIKRKHLKAFQSLLNDEKEVIKNNYRPTMPANNRPVYYHGEDLLAKDVLSMGKPFGLRSVDPAPIIGGEKGVCCRKAKLACCGKDEAQEDICC